MVNCKPPQCRVARPQLCPHGLATPRGAPRDGKDEGRVLPFGLAPSTRPTHGCSRAKSGCCRAAGTPDLSPPRGLEGFPFSQVGSFSKAAWSPLPGAVGDALPVLSGYSLTAGWGGAAGEVSSAPDAACETEGTSASAAAAAAAVPAPRCPLPPTPQSGAQGCRCLPLPPPPHHPSSMGPAAHTRSL